MPARKNVNVNKKEDWRKNGIRSPICNLEMRREACSLAAYQRTSCRPSGSNEKVCRLESGINEKLLQQIFFLDVK